MKSSFERARALLRRLPPEESEPDEPGENLLARMSLAPPPPPVGRSSAAYVYEAGRDRGRSAREQQRERRYDVCEHTAAGAVVRHSSPSLFGATDRALEVHRASGGHDVEVVRVDGEKRTTVLRVSGGRAPEGDDAAKAAVDILAVGRDDEG
jgi:hypothetical protein